MPITADSTKRRRGSLHVHLYYSDWTRESRAWRAGRSAIESGYAGEVLYVGYQVPGLPNEERRSDAEIILRLPPPPSAPGTSRWLRARSLPNWTIRIVSRFGCRKDIGLVVCHSLAALPAAVALKLITGAPLLYDAHELETEREGWSTPVRGAAQMVERSLIRFCDQTLVVSESIRNWYRTKYFRVPVTTLRNTPSVTLPILRSDQLRRDLGLRDVDLVCLYLGGLGPGRGIEEMMEAAEGLPAQTHFVFVGYGELEPVVRELAMRLPNIHLLPPVPSESVVSYASGADIGISLIKGSSLSYQFALPNKLFEYILAGLTPIVSDLPEQRRLVEECGYGWVIPPSGDELLRLLTALNRTNVRALQKPLSEALPTWQYEESRLVQVYAQLSGKE